MERLLTQRRALSTGFPCPVSLAGGSLWEVWGAHPRAGPADFPATALIPTGPRPASRVSKGRIPATRGQGIRYLGHGNSPRAWKEATSGDLAGSGLLSEGREHGKVRGSASPGTQNNKHLVAINGL